MFENGVSKTFISDIDKFLRDKHVLNPKTPSQMKEIYKHQRLAELRDNPAASKDQDLFASLEAD